MDASDQPPSTKRQILLRALTFDFISNMPDNVLHYIVSFLSTKEAIRTSILSTRWRYIWTYISKIKLVDDPSSSIKLCPEYVSRVLNLHDASDIERLCLELSAPVDYSHLHLWIENAGKHNVRYLDLDLSLKGRFKLPMWLFTFHSLVVLKLCIECVLMVPKLTRFSDLTTLHLCKITFAGMVSMHRLFLNCPVLDNLALVNCEWKHIKKVTISIPSLRSLTIVHELPLQGFGCVIKIHTPNLKYLNFTSTLNVDFRLDNLRHLVRAYVDFICEHVLSIEEIVRAIRIFKGISNVKCLSITNGFLYLLTFRYPIPEFYRLDHLEVVSELDPELSGFFLQFLDKVPNLELLNLAKSIMPSCLLPYSVEAPSCFNSLERIIISNYKAIPEEMKLLEFLLKNTTVLETIVIDASNELRMDRKKLEKVRNYLRELAMRSECDGIELHI